MTSIPKTQLLIIDLSDQAIVKRRTIIRLVTDELSKLSSLDLNDDSKVSIFLILNGRLQCIAYEERLSHFSFPEIDVSINAESCNILDGIGKCYRNMEGIHV